MVTKKILLFFLVVAFAVSATAQLNEVNRLPEVNGSDIQKDYSENVKGYWMAVEASGAYSCRLFNSNFGYTELDAVMGYRFNEYFRGGVGFGARYYFDNDEVRVTGAEWAFPIFANARGNFIPTKYRSVVPFYSFDIGGTVRDGFMVRPSVGLRIGRERSAFLVSIGYSGQDISTYSKSTGDRTRKFVSFVNMKIGYEF